VPEINLAYKVGGILSPTFNPKDAGITVPFKKSNIPSLHHSKFPKMIISLYQKLRKTYGKSISWTLIIVVLIMVLLSQHELAAFDRIPEADLLRRYAPVLYFHPDEKIYPWGIDSMLVNADLKMLRNKREAPLPLLPDNLSSNNSDKLYLDLRNIVPYYDTSNTPNLLQTFGKFPFRVYGRRVNPQNNSTHIVLQYWLFYPFNHWHNDHEGDWELVQIRYAKDRHEPDQLTTSHHNSGTVVPWENVGKINRTHPKIFVANGGHGNWPTPGNHAVGKIWSIIGIFRDKTSENGMVLYPGDILNSVSKKERKYMLEDISDLPQSSWPHWNGRWGDVKALFWGSKGPESPGVQYKWKNPIKWGNKPAKSSFWVYFGSPGVLHIYDPHDNHVGLTKKDQKEIMEGNIPGTYFYVPSSNAVPKDCAWINTSENLRFEIKATRSGKFNFSFDFDPGSVGQREGKIAISVIYKDIKITKGGIARINVPSEKLSKQLETILSEEPLEKKESRQGDFE